MDQGERSLRRQEDFHAIQTLRLTRSKDNELFSASHTVRQQLHHLTSKREEGKIEGKGYGAEAVGLC